MWEGGCQAFNYYVGIQRGGTVVRQNANVCEQEGEGGCVSANVHIYIYFFNQYLAHELLAVFTRFFAFFFRFFRFFKMSVLLCSFFMIKLCRSIPCKKKAAITRISIFRCTLRFLQQYSTHHRYHPLVKMRSIQQNIYFTCFLMQYTLFKFIYLNRHKLDSE